MTTAAADPGNSNAVRRPAVARLSVLDDMFWRGHHGFSPLIVMQGIWLLDHRIDPATLAPLHRSLSRGKLSRTVGRPRIALARNYFRNNTDIAELRVDTAPVGDVLAWANERARRELDIDRGPVWELSVADTDRGKSVISLVCSHVVADGLGMLDAVASALSVLPVPLSSLPGSSFPGSSPTLSSPHSGGARPTPRDDLRCPTPRDDLRCPTPRDDLRCPTLCDDLSDAARQLAVVITGVCRSLIHGCIDPATRRELLHAARPAIRQSEPLPDIRCWSEPAAVVDVSRESWLTALTTLKVSPTALLAILVADIVTDIRGDDEAEIAVPLSGPGDRLSANTISMTSVSVRPSALTDSEHGQPAEQALTPAATRLGPPGGMPAELLQLVGHRRAARIAADPGGCDGLASVLGDVPAEFTGSTGLSGRVAVRAVHPDMTASAARQTRTAIRAWAIGNARVITISVTATDTAVGNRDELTHILSECGIRHGLKVLPW